EPRDPGPLRRGPDFQPVGELLTNAIKFTPEGGTVAVSARLSGKSVIVAVEDDGPGVPDEDRDSIFQPYRRRHAAVNAGKGLGLYIARGIIEAHGGKLDIDGNRTKGSRFVFTLR